MLRSITGVLLLSWTVIFASQAAASSDPYEALSVLRVEKTPAPDFSLPSVDGETISLSDYRGKAVLVGFFKTF